MDKYDFDKTAVVQQFNNQPFSESYEAFETLYDIRATEHDSNFRDRFTQALRVGFLAYVDIINGQREIENSYFEIELQRKALKIVRSYHLEVVGSTIFGGRELKDFHTYVEETFGHSKFEMSVEGAIIDFAYELYQIKFEDPFGNETLEWLINSIDS